MKRRAWERGRRRERGREEGGIARPTAREAGRSDEGDPWAPGPVLALSGCPWHAHLMRQALGWERELLIPEKSEKVPGAEWTFQQATLMEGVMCEPAAEGQVAKGGAEFQEAVRPVNAEVAWAVREVWGPS